MSSRMETRTRLVEEPYDIPVYTCDRCGVEENHGDGWGSIGLYGQRGYDLCPDCYVAVIEAMGIGGE